MADGKLRLPYVNLTMLTGRVTRDAELHETTKATQFVVFDLACSRKWKDRTGQEKEDVLFKRITCYRGADYLAAELTRGRPVYVEGSERTETVLLKGKETKKNIFYASRVQVLDWQGGYTPPEETAAPAPMGDDEDLPF